VHAVVKLPSYCIEIYMLNFVGCFQFGFFSAIFGPCLLACHYSFDYRDTVIAGNFYSTFFVHVVLCVVV